MPNNTDPNVRQYNSLAAAKAAALDLATSEGHACDVFLLIADGPKQGKYVVMRDDYAAQYGWHRTQHAAKFITMAFPNQTPVEIMPDGTQRPCGFTMPAGFPDDRR